MPWSDPQKELDYQAQYREEHRQRKAELNRQHYLNNGADIRAQKVAAHLVDPSRQREANRKWRSTPEAKELRLDRYREKHYGLSRAEVDRRLAEQEGHCALCPRLLTALTAHADHDHETGRVRGMLCRGCNVGLGLLGDSAEGLRTALAYLERK